MKKHVMAFCKRGLIAAWGGPVIMAIVWLCLKSAGVVETLTVDQAVLGIISTTVMAFVAAGISIVLISVFRITEIRQFRSAVIDYRSFLLAALILALTRWVPQTKKLHPVIFIAVSALIGIVFHMSA